MDNAPRTGANSAAFTHSQASSSPRRLASNKNHVRRSASSIHISSKLAVATSPCSSHNPCVSRMLAVSCLLSSRSLGQHVVRRHELRIVVEDALQAADVPDRAQRHAAELAHPLRDRVRSGEDLVGMLVEKEVIVAKMRPRHVPVKVLGLEVEREHVGKESIQRPRDVPHCIGLEVGRRVERCHPPRFCIVGIHRIHPYLVVETRKIITRIVFQP